MKDTRTGEPRKPAAQRANAPPRTIQLSADLASDGADGGDAGGGAAPVRDAVVTGPPPGSYATPTTVQPPPRVIEKFERLKAKFLALCSQARRLREDALELRVALRENERRAAEHRRPPEGFALKRQDLERKIGVVERELADTEASMRPLGQILPACKQHLLQMGFNVDDPIPSTLFVSQETPGRGLVSASHSTVVRGA